MQIKPQNLTTKLNYTNKLRSKHEDEYKDSFSLWMNDFFNHLMYG
jgi:hypothetical protein